MIPAPSPASALPVTSAATAAAKAAASILPSRPMSTTPARSDQRPARQAQMSGVASRTDEASTCRTVSSASIRPPFRGRAGRGAA